MTVTHRAEPESPARHIYGPGDLQGLSSGVVVLTGPTTEAERAFWAIPLGLFAARGGSITWRKP